MPFFFFFSSRRRHTRCSRDWSSDVCSSDLYRAPDIMVRTSELVGVEAARLKIEALRARSEERRVGKECRSRWSPYHYKKNKGQTIKNHGDDDSDHRRGLTGARKRDHHLSFSAGDTDHLRPFFFSSRRRHTRFSRDWSSDVCSSDLPIELIVSSDIGPVIDEVYPLYVQVYERSKLHFEKLTKEYFCRLSRAMPDKVRFFVWRRNGKAVAFGECLVHGDTMFAEYLGLDYSIALKLHLYHYVFRDLVRWAMTNGY